MIKKISQILLFSIIGLLMLPTSFVLANNVKPVLIDGILAFPMDPEAETIETIVVDDSVLRSGGLLLKKITVYSDGAEMIHTARITSSTVEYDDQGKYIEYIYDSEDSDSEDIRTNIGSYGNSIWGHEVGVQWDSRNLKSSISKNGLYK